METVFYPYHVIQLDHCISKNWDTLMILGSVTEDSILQGHSIYLIIYGFQISEEYRHIQSIVIQTVGSHGIHTVIEIPGSESRESIPDDLIHLFN